LRGSALLQNLEGGKYGTQSRLADNCHNRRLLLHRNRTPENPEGAGKEGEKQGRVRADPVQTQGVGLHS